MIGFAGSLGPYFVIGYSALDIGHSPAIGYRQSAVGLD
jgi:hypothetical protein